MSIEAKSQSDRQERDPKSPVPGDPADLSMFSVGLAERPGLSGLPSVDSNLPAQGYTVTVSKSGNPIVHGVRIFRSGSFRDMTGNRTEWTDTDIAQIAANFKRLRETGVLADVPVREDHDRSQRNVVGYLDNVYLDPINPSFLAADIEFTTREGFQKWSGRHYRGRSAEVGSIEANDGATHGPVIVGLAFVDIPAVEGLYGRPVNPTNFTHVIRDQEAQMTPEDFTKACAYAQALADWHAALAEGQWDVASKLASDLDDDSLKAYTYAAFEEAATYAASLAPEQPAAPAPAPANHAAPVQVHAFRVAGQPVSDFAAVQSHIDALEQFQSAAIQSERNRAVDDWAREGKVAQPQVDSLKTLASTMSPTQWEAFAASYAAAPASPLFSAYGNPVNSSEQPTPPGQSSDDEQFALLVDTLKNHKRAGMSQESIEKSPTWARFQAACQSRGTTPAQHIQF